MYVICDKKNIKNIQKFCCEICDFKCSKKGDWNRHLSTSKHAKHSKNDVICDDFTSKNIYLCDLCNKEYSSRNGLWSHKKHCKQHYKDYLEDEEQMDINYLVKYLMKENTELKNMLFEQQNVVLEIAKTAGSNTSNSHNTTNNSHNKTFNLQVFLNETCKDAMNIMDFVETIKLQLSDLEKIGEVGYVQGISNIITTNLKALDVTQRPVHCTDKKRETVYIKDDNEWKKEDENKTKLRKIVQKVADKNIRLLPQFREKYPDYKDSSSKTSDKYDKIVIEAMVCDSEKDSKIIHNISNSVTIDKYMK